MMTPPKGLPYGAAQKQDEAAELVNTAAENLELAANELPKDKVGVVLKEVCRLQRGLRILQENGARIRVPMG
jgi:hypothetical protein